MFYRRGVAGEHRRGAGRVPQLARVLGGDGPGLVDGSAQGRTHLRRRRRSETRHRLGIRARARQPSAGDVGIESGARNRVRSGHRPGQAGHATRPRRLQVLLRHHQRRSRRSHRTLQERPRLSAHGARRCARQRREGQAIRVDVDHRHHLGATAGADRHEQFGDRRVRRQSRPNGGLGSGRHAARRGQDFASSTPTGSKDR